MLAMLAGCGELPRPFAGHPGAMAERLARPPPARLAVLPDPSAPALAPAMADALVAREVPAVAGPAHPGDWRLLTSDIAAGGRVVPHFVVQDPAGAAQGSLDGAPVDAALWPAAAADAGRNAAAPIADLLTSIDAARRQSDPNSLLNRPARLAFAGVSGAPGDGDTSLAQAMRGELARRGLVLGASPRDADFTLRGQVTATAIAGGQQRVEILWIVDDANGREAGRVAQLNDVPAGTLAGFWGDVAQVVAQQAAGGVREVIVNQTGAKPAGSKPIGAKQAGAKQDGTNP
ncbi:MAG: hypothetical protein KGJ41_06390, partial [Rhodospirillales bacterium]|nr:hypothetical protein [Rhodospirillales bacterium]